MPQSSFKVTLRRSVKNSTFSSLQQNHIHHGRIGLSLVSTKPSHLHQKQWNGTRSRYVYGVFAYEYAAEVLSFVVPGSLQLQNHTPYKSVMHYTPDISEYVNFNFYQWCYYWDETEKKIGHWLGVAHQVG